MIKMISSNRKTNFKKMKNDNWALNCESLNSLNRYRSKLFAIEILRLNKYFNIFFKTKKRGYMEIVLRPARSSIRIIGLILNCSGSRLYDLCFFPIFSFKQTRGGSYHRSYKLDKERVSLSPTSEGHGGKNVQIAA